MGFTLNLFIIIADQLMLFIINLLVARHAGDVLFGDYTVATNALMLLGTMFTLGMDSIIAYYVPKYYIQNKYSNIVTLTQEIINFLKPLYVWVVVLGSLCTITLISLTLALRNIALFDVSHPLYLFLWGTVALSLYAICKQYFRAINYMRTAVILSLLQTIVYFILSLIIYFYLYPALFNDNKHYFPHIMLIGFIASYTLIIGVAFFLYKRTELSTIEVKSAHAIAWKDKIYGYTIQNLNRYIFTAIPLMMIEWLGRNEHSVGLFAAIISIISLALIAIAPIGILIGPDISAAFAQSRDALKRVMQKYLMICVSIALITILIIGIFAKQILLLYQSNFTDALPYLYVCLINILTFSITMPLARMVRYSHRGSEIGAKLTLSLLLFQLIACIILINWLGLLGAIICYVGINIVYILVILVISLRIYKTAPFDEMKN
ncbi:Polysaccharide biosynthesis protein [Legionella beliardensis]|uniref:Polysaccharide biosynthesis protein n=1 Tax=Legionella beliardensis TaxID=91822 RepID=A0A378HYI0_9GAMM|nr:oligosaccharide flippase family protein [Legionella beliardensis]STX27591.1 Polysaccharide biosynthesis protein [Legionella beliardensis]